MGKEGWKDSSLWQEGQQRAKKLTKPLMPLAYFIILIVFLGMLFGSLCLNINWTTALLGGGLIFNIAGALYLVFGAIPTNETAYNMSTTRYNGNPDLLAAILANRRAARIGILFIAAGFAIQFGIFLRPLL